MLTTRIAPSGEDVKVEPRSRSKEGENMELVLDRVGVLEKVCVLHTYCHDLRKVPYELCVTHYNGRLETLTTLLLHFTVIWCIELRCWRHIVG